MTRLVRTPAAPRAEVARDGVRRVPAARPGSRPPAPAASSSARRGAGVRRRLRAVAGARGRRAGRGAAPATRRRRSRTRSRRSSRRGAGRRAARGLALVCRARRRLSRAVRDLDDAPAVLHVAGDAGRLAGLVGGTVEDGAARWRSSARGAPRRRGWRSRASSAGAWPRPASPWSAAWPSASTAPPTQARSRRRADRGGAGRRGGPGPYPASKRALTRRLVSAALRGVGAAAGFALYRWCFPARNRTIAALGGGDGRRRGRGALGLADHRRGRRRPRPRGRRGAGLGRWPGARRDQRAAARRRDVVRDARDVLDAVLGGDAGGRARRAAVARPTRRGASRGIDPSLRADARRRSSPAATPWARWRRRRRTSAAVLAALSELELLGALRRGAGGRTSCRTAAVRG